MHRFYHIPDRDKAEIIQQAAGQTGLPAYAVEKDWWVVQTLTALFQLEIAPHLVFKGGTSLSKAWGLIERFSEDIDLAVDRSFFGYEGDLGKNQRTKLRKEANTYITTVIYPGLQTFFQNQGLTGIKIELEEIKSSDQDPIIINIHYPFVIKSPGYLLPRVQIEIGCRSLHEPHTIRPIRSLVDEVFSNLPFTLSPIQIPAVNPERTFLEKIFLLHEEFQRPPEKRRVDRLSRHLYDIYQLSRAQCATDALNNPELYQTIIHHRQTFTRLAGVDYRLHQPQTINPIPPQAHWKDWELDYQTMQEQMIFGNSPNFKELILGIEALKKRMKGVEWGFSMD